LQEAGFDPLEVLRTATAWGAELLGMEGDIGTLEIGKCADILIHDENPLGDFKLLYGTGAMRLDDPSASVTRSLSAIIKDAAIFDAAELLGDVEEMVAARRGAARTTTEAEAALLPNSSC
jgi:imidazolonepropionase-like amidohydrolase